MSNPNVTDTSGIQALLETLRSSQVWAAAVGTQIAPGATDTTALRQAYSNSDLGALPRAEEHGRSGSAVFQSDHTLLPESSLSLEQSSVASLLSRLQSSAVPEFSAQSAQSASAPINSSFATPLVHKRVADTASPAASASAHRQKDFRTFTFQQALAHLGQLAKDESFLQAVKSMKSEQDDLERKLWEEREEIIHRHEQKVKAAKAKAQIVGGGLSKHDAEMLSTAVQRELRQFDTERVLPAWDGLTSKHQAAMEILTVPSMFVTSEAADLQKQAKVMRVLEGIVNEA